jgi:single-strand DNA-binding protein
MNNVVLVGRLTKEPQLKKTNGGTSVCEFTLAVQRDKGNADFPNVVTFGKTAENLAQWQHQGSKIGVVGRLQTRTYDRQDGSKAYVTEVIANNVEYLSSKSEMSAKQGLNEPTQEPVKVDITDDDLPW